MEEIAKEILDILLTFKWGLGALLAIIVFWLLLKYIDAFYKLKSSICGLFAQFSTYAQKGQISNRVRGTILTAVRKEIYNAEIIPTDLQVKWVDNEEPESFISNNQVIVRIKKSSNPHENLVMAVSEYVDEGLLYNVRRYLDKEVMIASKMLFIRKVLQLSSATSLAYLDENYTIPTLKESEDLKELYDTLARIDNNGMFVNILLNEFQKAGMSIYNEPEDPQLVAESREFMRYLHSIAMGLSDDVDRLCFNREYFKVAIFLAASNKTLNRSGIAPFLKAIGKKLDEGIETIYIFGLGSKRTVAELITSSIADYRINAISKHTYKHISTDGKRVMGVLFECGIYKEKE